MEAVEYVGIVAGVLILFSMCYPTNTFKATLLLRIFNLIGSIVFVVYGILLPAYATAGVNCGCVVVNSVQIVLLFKNRNKQKEADLKADEDVQDVSGEEDNL